MPSCLNCQVEASLPNHTSLTELKLEFTRDEPLSYLQWRAAGLNRKSINWAKKSAEIVWSATNGIVNKTNTDALRSYILDKYRCDNAKNKVLNFAKAFLKYLTKTRLDTRYYAFSLFLEKPKTLKERKNVTSRIITKEDVTNVLCRIKQAELDGTIDSNRAQQFTAFVLFGAYTGQRHMATTMKLTVGQFRDALKLEEPVIHVKPSQDKIKMEHYVP